MVRLASEPVDRPASMVWDGTIPTARKLIEWCRDGAGNQRFAWLPALNAPDDARVFVERPFPESASWERAPVGTRIVRRDETEDAPLSLVLPPEPTEILADEAA